MGQAKTQLYNFVKDI